MSVASFDSTKDFVSEILKDIGQGKTQLPDFQRGWVWDDDHIRELLASIAQSFPIGAVMTLQTGGADVSFKPRPIEGANEALPVQELEPETLILDGQQRLTSLFQALETGRPVSTKDNKGKKIRRWYYFDMKRCVADDPEYEEAILSIPEDKNLMRNFGRDVALDLSRRASKNTKTICSPRTCFCMLTTGWKAISTSGKWTATNGICTSSSTTK